MFSVGEPCDSSQTFHAIGRHILAPLPLNPQKSAWGKVQLLSASSDVSVVSVPVEMDDAEKVEESRYVLVGWLLGW